MTLDYRKPRTGVMLAYPLDEKRFNRWGGQAYCQPKLDGERCRLEYDPFLGSWQFFAAAGDCANFAVPHLVRRVNAAGLNPGLRLDGELYTHGLTQNEIHSIASRRTNLHPDHASLCFHCFDQIEPESTQFYRFMGLSMLWQRVQIEGFHLVHPEKVTSWPAVWAKLEEYYALGYEGIILRQVDGVYKPLDPAEKAKRSTSMMKFKPRQKDVYPIVGFKEETALDGTPKGALGSLTCETDGRTFSVGTGFSAEQRAAYWAEIQANPEPFTSGVLSLVVRYQHITSGSGKGHDKGVPYSPVVADIVLTGEEID